MSTETCRKVIAAAQRHGKVVIVGGMPECDALDALRREGAAPFIFAGIDSDVYLAALREFRARTAEVAAGFWAGRF